MQVQQALRSGLVVGHIVQRTLVAEQRVIGFAARQHAIALRHEYMRVVGQVFHQLHQQLLRLQELALVYPHLGQYQHQLGAAGVEVQRALKQRCGFVQPPKLAQCCAQPVYAVKIVRVAAQRLLQHCHTLSQAAMAQVQAGQLACCGRVGGVCFQQCQQLRLGFQVVAIQLCNFCSALNCQAGSCSRI